MLSRLICLIMLLIVSIAVHAQDLQYARQIIATLCSDHFHGRGFVRNGDKKAATMIRNEFREIGLKPLVHNYYQSFPISVNTFPRAVELILGNRKLVPGHDFLISPSSPSVKGTYALHTIKAEDLIRNDFLKDIPTGYTGFIIIDNRRSSDLDAGDIELLSGKISELLKNPVANFIGIIELTSENLVWGTSEDVSQRPYVTVSFPADPDTLETLYINIKNRFRKKYTTNNVLGYIRGTEYPDSFFVFTGHYDHLGLMGTDAYFPGANDNASGVAMLLYLAKFFQQHPPKMSIAFISFSAEEMGLLGSFHFVKHAPFDLKKIKFLINFDLVGTGNEGIKVVNGTVYPEAFQLLQEINSRHYFLPSISERGAACISDHCPFDYQGVPGFYIYTTGDSPGYHSVHDRPEALSMAGFEGLASTIVRFVSQFAFNQ